MYMSVCQNVPLKYYRQVGIMIDLHTSGAMIVTWCYFFCCFYYLPL